MPDQLKKTPPFKRDYKLLGYFYDHKKHTAGFVFKEEDLEEFVKKHKQDPPQTEVATPKNYSDEFAEKCRTMQILAFQTGHKFLEGHIINANYDRFEIWEKKQ